jgi:hypothetical protein
MFPANFDPIADYMAEDPFERIGVLTFGISSWLVAVVTEPPMSVIQSLIQIIPPILGIYVAHRSMERAHALRMEKLRQDRAKLPEDFPFDRKASAKPDDDTVDIP